MNESISDLLTSLDCEESAWEQVYRLRKSGRLQDPQSMAEIHSYLLACCRRIWLLIPDSGSRKAVVAGEKFCQGIITWEDARKMDWFAEASAFKFDYRDDTDPEILEYVSQVFEQRETAERLLVPPASLDQASIRNLLNEAAYFVDMTLMYRGMRFGKHHRRTMEDCGKFMPLKLFIEMTPDLLRNY